jgi:hypothetical protein
VLGRGEEFTGWNFERPSYSNHQPNGVGSGQSSANNSLRPLSSSSFGPTEFEYRQQGNVLLHENGRPIQNGGFPGGGGGNWGPKSPAAAAMGQGTRRFSQAEAAPVPSSFQVRKSMPWRPTFRGFNIGIRNTWVKKGIELFGCNI